MRGPYFKAPREEGPEAIGLECCDSKTEKSFDFRKKTPFYFEAEP